MHPQTIFKLWKTFWRFSTTCRRMTSSHASTKWKCWNSCIPAARNCFEEDHCSSELNLTECCLWIQYSYWIVRLHIWDFVFERLDNVKHIKPNSRHLFTNQDWHFLFRRWQFTNHTVSMSNGITHLFPMLKADVSISGETGFHKHSI
jgi:hypothetical protein